MNPTIQNIMAQLNYLSEMVKQNSARVPELNLDLPEYLTTPGNIRYPQMLPRPLYVRAIMKNATEASAEFGASTGVFSASYTPPKDRPVYLVRIMATQKVITSEEPSYLGHFRPLASNLFPAISTLEATNDFEWKFWQDRSTSNIVPEWLPSVELLGNDKKPGMVLPVQLELQRGVDLTFEAQSLKTGDIGYQLALYLELIEMIPDPLKVLEKQQV